MTRYKGHHMPGDKDDTMINYVSFISSQPNDFLINVTTCEVLIFIYHILYP